MMTRAEFARYMGVHRSQTTRWIAAGMPTNKDGSISPEPARTWVRKNVDPTRRALVHGGVTRSRAQQPAPESPEDDPVGSVIPIVLNWLATSMPKAVAVAALEAGMPRADAEQLFELVAAAAMEQTREILQDLSIPCRVAESWADAKLPPPAPMPAVEGAPA
jgi:hypothetical protein